MTVAEEIIARFSAVFGEPKTTDPELFLEEFAKCMEGRDAYALRKAADTLIRTSLFWPKPAELLAEMRRILDNERKPAEHIVEHRREPTPEAKANVLAMLEDFKKFMAKNVTVSAKNESEAEQFRRVQRPGFEEMQRNSPNKGLHMTAYGLSQLSRRMTGDRE